MRSALHLQCFSDFFGLRFIIRHLNHKSSDVTSKHPFEFLCRRARVLNRVVE